MDMTYLEAKQWLAKIGGEVREGEEAGKATMGRSIIVSVHSAKGPVLHRQCPFDDEARGYEREIAIRRAFVVACIELKAALM